MPPAKKKTSEPSKKTEQKKKEKVIEDKTFGLKNKKGSKNQKFIQQVQHQVQHGNQSARKVELKTADKGKKEDKKKEAEELNNIFKPVTIQKVAKGADPKSVLCAFYKQGQCTKGDKCKFSHDLNLERKAEKKSVYCDLRDEDLMENWDEEKLKEVVEKKHGEAEKKLPKTDIICRYFLDALENNKYGWFWECPNSGNKCHYRHALPNGFVLKRDAKKLNKKDELSIEEHVEIQRAQLGNFLTKITLQTFMAWKKKKLQEKKDELSKEQERKKAEFKAGLHVGLSGRDMFTFRPEMAMEDGMEDGDVAYDGREYSDDSDSETDSSPNASVRDKNIREISEELLGAEAREVDGTGTVVNERHWQLQERITDGNETSAEASGGSLLTELDDVPIDENLFEEDDEELDDFELQDGLEALTII